MTQKILEITFEATVISHFLVVFIAFNFSKPIISEKKLLSFDHFVGCSYERRGLNSISDLPSLLSAAAHIMNKN